MARMEKIDVPIRVDAAELDQALMRTRHKLIEIRREFQAIGDEVASIVEELAVATGPVEDES